MDMDESQMMARLGDGDRQTSHNQKGPTTRYANREYSQPVRSANVHAWRQLEARVTRVEDQKKAFQERHLRRLYDMRHLSRNILLKSQNFVEEDFRSGVPEEDPMALPQLRAAGRQTAGSPVRRLSNCSSLSPRSPSPSGGGGEKPSGMPGQHRGSVDLPPCLSPVAGRSPWAAGSGATPCFFPGTTSPTPAPTRTWRLRHAACTRESRSFRVLRSKYAALEVRDPDVYTLTKQRIRELESSNRRRLLSRVSQMCSQFSGPFS